MKRNIRLLAVALAAQLLLALGLSFTGPDLSAHAATAPLLSLAKDKLDRLTIEGPDKAEVILTKADGTWKLPGLDNFPADGAKIGQLVDRLNALKLGPPVATTSGAQERFKVSDAAFERRITLGGGGKMLATLYLGTSPSMRQVHARRADQKDVYAVDFATYDVPVNENDWEDKAILGFPKTDIASIDVAALHLKYVTGNPAPAGNGGKSAATQSINGKNAQPDWQATGLAASERLKPESADKLAGLLANLRIDKVLGPQEESVDGHAQPALTLAVVRNSGQRIEYRFWKTRDGQAYVLKASSRPEYFRLPIYSVEPLLEAAKRGALLEPRLAAAPNAKTRKKSG